MSELQKRVQTINDARLGREARAAYEKLRDQIAAWAQSQNSDPQDTDNKEELPAPKVAALDVYETLEKLRGELRRTTQGAEKRELERLKSIAEDMLQRADQQWSDLPRASEHLPGNPQAALEALRRRQLGLDQRLSDLQREEFAQELPPEGKAALDDASSEMQDSGRSLGNDRLLRANEGETLAIEAIQRAIDSLRQSPPPPPSSQSSDSSTQAEQDRSLREQVMDAMKEREASTLPKDVEAYYEELLR